MINYDWRLTIVANDDTHHLYNAQPIYTQRFDKVLKFHAPGLAPVIDKHGAYHIDIKGNSIYQQRFLQTFGYYENIAAVESSSGWFHIDITGAPIYETYYAWCGNFQEGLCVVKDLNTQYYYHINCNGHRLYKNDYAYVGDYRDGVAVVCDTQGMHTHIDMQGNYVHNQWFAGLDVFHKSVARAKDRNGWFHIDKKGKALYAHRYKQVEPYYNNVAHVETFDGSLLTINLQGHTITTIYKNSYDLLHELSADLVGFWKTQTIYAAVALNIFDALPNFITNIVAASGLNEKNCQRLLRALQELGLVTLLPDGSWQATLKGSLLKAGNNNSLADAAIVWGKSHYQRWSQLIDCLQTPTPDRSTYFDELATDKDALLVYQQALSNYALQDYNKIITAIEWHQHHTVIDAGGGTGALLHYIVNQYPHLHGVLLDMPAVIDLTKPHPRCSYYKVNFFEPWSCQADAIILARVLHDWHDKQAVAILKQAKASLLPHGKIYVLEMVLDSETSMGSLLDLNMLVMTGGCERSLTEWLNLAASAQLKISNIFALTPVVSLLVMVADG